MAEVQGHEVWRAAVGRHAENKILANDNIRVSVIIPTLNEAQNLAILLPSLPPWLHEVIIVDGRSTDDTIEVARTLRPDVRVVLEKRKGKGVALRSGFEAATGDILVMMDADGSMNPAEIGLFVRHLRDGADFVKGSRFMQGAGSHDISWLRRLGNSGFTILVRLLYGGRYSDLCYGYAAFWNSVLPELALDGDGFEIETQMNIRALQSRLKIVEVPSFEFDRVHGESNLRTFPDGWRVLKTIFAEAVPRRLKARRRSKQAEQDPSVRGGEHTP